MFLTGWCQVAQDAAVCWGYDAATWRCGDNTRDRAPVPMLESSVGRLSVADNGALSCVRARLGGRWHAVRAALGSKTMASSVRVPLYRQRVACCIGVVVCLFFVA